MPDGDLVGGKKEIAVAVNDARTGELVDRLPAQQLLAMARASSEASCCW
ncbi:hypothetical protein [Streptomyces sp. NPDC002790]